MNLDDDDLRRAQMVMIISRPVRKHKEASVWPVQCPSRWWCRARAPGHHDRQHPIFVVVVGFVVVVVIIVVFMTIILIVWSCICTTSAPDPHALQRPINAGPAAM